LGLGLLLLVLKGLAELGIEQSALSLVAVGTSAMVAVRSLDAQKRLERERQLGERRDKLIESYRDVYDLAMGGKTPSEEQMRRFNVDLTFYGNEELIKAWLGLRRLAGTGQTAPAEILPAQMNLVKAMRKDLGHQDKSLTDMDLFGIVLANPEEFEALLSSQEKSSE
jgi:hypothetical protein